jgi:type II secretory pathway pseudopilin PulG
MRREVPLPRRYLPRGSPGSLEVWSWISEPQEPLEGKLALMTTGKPSVSQAGLTLVELVASFGILSVVLGSVLVAVMGTQDAFLENQIVSQLNLRAQLALDRIVELASQALTTDSVFSALSPSTGVSSHGLRFRLVQYIDTATGNPVYDSTNLVYIYGPDSGADPCQGLVVGRGPSWAVIHSSTCGADGFVGTADDNTSVLSGGNPMVEILMPSKFAPQTGDMFAVDVSPAPIGRFLTFTLRLNARGQEGNYLLPTDLVLTEKIALRH